MRAVRQLVVCLTALLVAVTTGCRTTSPAAPGSAGSTTGEPPALSQVTSWAYQVDGLAGAAAADALANAPYDMLVIEPTRTLKMDEAHAQFPTKDLVARLKASPATAKGKRKLVLAVLDVATATPSRWYWNWSTKWPDDTDRPADWPNYIMVPGDEDPDNTYPVAYWEEDWQKVLFTGVEPSEGRDYDSSLDEIIKDGFDGVYLVGVDRLNQTSITEAAKEAEVDPKAEMLGLLEALREYARQRNPGFLVIQQGAMNLRTPEGKPAPSIDAVACESLWYYGSTGGFEDADSYDQAQDGEWTAAALGLLREYKKAGKPVFLLEYARAKAPQVYDEARKEGFVAYCAHPTLAQLSSTPPTPTKP